MGKLDYFSGRCTWGVRALDGLLADFSQRYGDRQKTHSVLEVHFRLNCILASLVRLYPMVSAGAIRLNDLNVRRFERNLSFLVRYALSEMCIYYRFRCK